MGGRSHGLAECLTAWSTRRFKVLVHGILLTRLGYAIVNATRT